MLEPLLDNIMILVTTNLYEPHGNWSRASMPRNIPHEWLWSSGGNSPDVRFVYR